MSLNGNTLQVEINKGIKLIETNNFSEAEKDIPEVCSPSLKVVSIISIFLFLTII